MVGLEPHRQGGRQGPAQGNGRRGDLIVEIRVMLWDHPDQKVIDLMRSLARRSFPVTVR